MASTSALVGSRKEQRRSLFVCIDNQGSTVTTIAKWLVGNGFDFDLIIENQIPDVIANHDLIHLDRRDDSMRKPRGAAKFRYLVANVHRICDSSYLSQATNFVPLVLDARVDGCDRTVHEIGSIWGKLYEPFELAS